MDVVTIGVFEVGVCAMGSKFIVVAQCVSITVIYIGCSNGGDGKFKDNMGIGLAVR